MPKAQDLTNIRFGKLTAIEKTNKRKDGCIVWKCQCDCGNIIEIPSRSLKSGNTKSCGCFRKEENNKRFSKDIKNLRFGKLIALSPTEERKHGSIVWNCKCDCGNFCKVSAEQLLAGKTQSCGCLNSKGNQLILNLLQQSNYNFSSEYFVIINNIRYAFDFVVFNTDNSIKCFIEYDGILHFEQDKYHGWSTKENWEKTHTNDIIKNNYCFQYKIPLIRIPYTEYNNITLNYLQERIEKCQMDIQ